MNEITLFDSNFSHQQFICPHTKASDSKYPTPKITWKRDGVRRKINFYTDNFIKKEIITVPQDGNKSVCLLLEPYTNPPWTDVYDYIQTDFEKFDLIITHNKQKLGHLIDSRPDKFVYTSLCHTTIWFDENVVKLYPKSKMISMPFSFKTYSEGHRLRHVIYEKYKDTGLIDFYGSGVPNNTNTFEDSFKDYKYSIAIENCLQKGYNSEKLYDTFLTGCIPLYWGSRLENKNFDDTSLFYFSPDRDKIDFNFDESLENFDKLIKFIHDTDPYESLFNSVVSNYKYMVEHMNSENNIYDILVSRNLI